MKKRGQQTGKRLLAGLLAAALICSGARWAGSARHALADGEIRELAIDGNTMIKDAQTAYRGLGTVTCNNSSRLLMDYKEQHPDQYWEIMNWLFSKEKGAGLSHIKIELGCDSNTSSGAEPATKRSAGEKANVSRGAGFLFAHDALTINPDISLDMLCWGMPAWVQEAYDISEKAGFRARYRWYKETLDAAYDTWGLRFAYISANRNEKPIEEKWTIYLDQQLQKEASLRYDYSQIKLVAADETDTMKVAESMLKNKKYRNAVDVIGCHYNSYMDKKVLKLNQQYGKEIWFSEGASVATDTIFGANNTEDRVSTSGENGVLDIANRIIIGYAQSRMTMYEFQPSVASYYDGSVYYPKQLLSANHPWSGYYQVTAGLAMAMHFNSFIQKGWQYVGSGSYGDGTQSDHTIHDTKNNYLTAADPASGNYSTVITNDSSSPRVYQVKVSGLAAASAGVTVWETRSNGAEESYDAGWLQPIASLTPVQDNGVWTYTVTVSPYTMVTVTTTTGQLSYAQRKEGTSAGNKALDTPLPLPYRDDFEYTDEFLVRRGGTPQYTTDQDGAFEVEVLEDGSRVLAQKLNRDMLPEAWGGKNNDPVTSLGDDTWKDYIVSADAMLDRDSRKKSDYIGLCARYNCSGDIGDNGYWLRVYRSGKWTLTANTGKLAQGKIAGIRQGRWMTLQLAVQGNTVTPFINGKQMKAVTITRSLVNSGRIALGSSYACNYYDNIQVRPLSGGVPAITRVDDLDSSVAVSEGVSRKHSQSYVYYGRTLTSLEKKGDSLSFSFQGTGISLLGRNFAGTRLRILIDGEEKEASYAIKETDNRAVFWQTDHLAEGTHTIQVSLVKGQGLTLDALEIQGASWQDTGAKASGIQLEADQININYGQAVDLKPVLLGENPTDTITYTTSDASVAVVTSDGRVHGNGSGTATVTAHTENGAEASCKITVTELKITVSKGHKLRLGVGEHTFLSAGPAGKKKTGTILWSSSDKNIVDVNGRGGVTARKAGTARITAATEDGCSRSVLITVKRAPAKVAVAPGKLKLAAGSKKQLKCRLSPGSLGKVTFRSRNKRIAAVSASGQVKAKRRGKTVITVTTYNNKKAKVKVTVKAKGKAKRK